MISVTVGNIPNFIDHKKLLFSDYSWQVISKLKNHYSVITKMERQLASDQIAELRNLVIAGHCLEVECSPPLKRAVIRKGRENFAKLKRFQPEPFKNKQARLDEQGRYSLTSEVLSDTISSRALEMGFTTVVDGFCGCGGNAISFAKCGLEVSAIEIDHARIEMAKFNASLYRVHAKINFIIGDILDSLNDLSADLLFLDPPWETQDKEIISSFDSSGLLKSVLSKVKKEKFKNIWLKLPTSFDLSGHKLEFVEAMYNTHPKNPRVIKFLLVGISL